MRITLRLLALLAATFWLAQPARADININGNYVFPTNIAVQNNTDQDITFVRTNVVCSSASPESFVAHAKSETQIQVWQDYHDHGLNNCYGRYHTVTYAQQDAPQNFLRVAQHLSSNDPACTDIKNYIVFWINYAVCPESGGNVIAPRGVQGNEPDSGNGVFCPPSTPWCPPSDNGYQQYFGFVINPPGIDPATGRPPASPPATP